nr:PAS domain S-box protein [Methanocella sp. CWC-04]
MSPVFNEDIKDEDKTKEQLIAELVELRRLTAKQNGSWKKSRPAEEMLNWENILLHNMSDGLPVAIYFADHVNDKILYFNNNFLKLWNIEHLEKKLRSGELKHSDIVSNLLLRVKDKVSFARTMELLQNENCSHIAEEETLLTDGRVIRLYSFMMRDAGNRYLGRSYSYNDVTARKIVQDAEKKNLNFLQVLMNTIPLPIFYKNREGIYIGCNEAFEKYLGFDRDSIIGKTVFDLAPENLAKIYKNADDSLFNSGGIQVYESRVKNADGSEHDVIFNKATYLNPDGSIGGMVGTILDITERKRSENDILKMHRELETRVAERTSELKRINEALQTEIKERNKAEEELEKSIKKYKELADLLPQIVFEIDINGNITFVNKSAFGLTKYNEEDFKKGLNAFQIISLEDRDRLKENMSNALKGNSEGGEYRIRRKDGSTYPGMIHASVIYQDDRPAGLRGFIIDITELKQAEKRIQASLAEKEVLIKEIHHRVKNNLQIISSLLSLQFDYIRDEKDLEIFKESQDRVRTMALIHEKMYQSKDLANVDISEYMDNLTSYLFRSYGVDRNIIGLEIESGEVYMNVNTAVPCGLIINELVSNSLKYAFPNGRKGKISIKLKPKNIDRMVLTIMDDGIGLPEEKNIDNNKSLGLQLVHALTEQINGSIRLYRNDGTRFEIEFPHSKI